MVEILLAYVIAILFALGVLLIMIIKQIYNLSDKIDKVIG
jgi:hypothetical protein